MTRNFSPNDNNDDLAVIAVKQLTASSSASDVDALPAIFTYDWLGNLLSVTNGATSTSAALPPPSSTTLPVTYRQSSTTVTSDSRSPTPYLRRLQQALGRAACTGPTSPPRSRPPKTAHPSPAQQINGSYDRALLLRRLPRNPSSGTFSSELERRRPMPLQHLHPAKRRADQPDR